MTRRGQRTSFQERLEIIERAAAGQSDPEIATMLGCSVWTVRKWRRIGQRHGRKGLTSRMGRPARGPLSSFPSALRDAIVCQATISNCTRIASRYILTIERTGASPAILPYLHCCRLLENQPAA